MTSTPDTAEVEGLRHVNDTRPGITRKRNGKGFSYWGPHGNRITDAATLDRIRALVIPPGYRDVWICPLANGHIQATGIDERGRKQYRYHPRWRAARDEAKFEHVLRFGAKLPSIRRKVARHMNLHGLQRTKVLATVVQLLEKTLIRIGNEEYAQENHSYGLATLRKKHVAVSGSEITFEFTGKSGKRWNLSVHDRRIAAVCKRCAEIPGYELFKYFDDDGVQRDVDSADVNDYLKEISGEEFTAKDFRTWAGTVLAAIALAEFEKYDSEAQAKRNVVHAIETVASQLGNTPAVCRKCYVHPEILNGYLDDSFREMIGEKIRKKLQSDSADMSDEEVLVLAFLRKRMRRR
jgi:DNA topoisomerase-1